MPLQALRRSGSVGRTPIRASDGVAMTATLGRSQHPHSLLEVQRLMPAHSRSCTCRTHVDCLRRRRRYLGAGVAGIVESAAQAGGPKRLSPDDDFLSTPRASVPCCLLLDVTLPGLNGLELQQQLGERTDMPIIFITGHGDIPMTVRAMKAGAAEFLTKPLKMMCSCGRYATRSSGVEPHVASMPSCRD